MRNALLKKNPVLLALTSWLLFATTLTGGGQNPDRKFQTLSNASRVTVATVVPRAGDYQFQFDQQQASGVSAKLKLWVDQNGDGTIDASSLKRQKVWLPSNFRQADFRSIVETEARKRLGELFPNKIPPAMESRLKIAIIISTNPPEYAISLEW